MTAEVAILNKTGIALAADSAVTTTNGNQLKVHNSADKIFILSKYKPVGIMIYANSEFMSIPWETLIKIYQDQLGLTCFDTLQEYGDNFIKFLSNSNYCLSNKRQEESVETTTERYLHTILEKVEIKKENDESTDDMDEEENTKNILSEVINEYVDKIESYDILPNFSEHFIVDFIERYKENLKNVANRVFGKFPIDNDLLGKLLKISAGVMMRDNFSLGNESGIVIAGFGQQDIYPSLCSYDISCVVMDKLKYRKKLQIEENNNAIIIPFAQTEMVEAFLHGIEPKLDKIFLHFLETTFITFSEEIAKKYINPETKNDKTEDIKKLAMTVFESYREIIKDEQRKYSAPILETLESLPKNKLAVVAENLVRLTTFKYQVSMAPSTVGGPIDVAVISKGDGFIWIKKKQYFKPELNMSFAKNYFRGDDQ